MNRERPPFAEFLGVFVVTALVFPLIILGDGALALVGLAARIVGEERMLRTELAG